MTTCTQVVSQNCPIWVIEVTCCSHWGGQKSADKCDLAFFLSRRSLLQWQFLDYYVSVLESTSVVCKHTRLKYRVTLKEWNLVLWTKILGNWMKFSFLVFRLQKIGCFLSAQNTIVDDCCSFEIRFVILTNGKTEKNKEIKKRFVITYSFIWTTLYFFLFWSKSSWKCWSTPTGRSSN